MLTIHYQGTSEPQIIRNLTTELKAISEEMDWKCFVIDDEDFVGIIISVAEKCEPLTFVINRQGKLIHPAWFNHKNPPEAAFYVSTKTNFSTIDIHIAIVKLIKYIKIKYIPNISVTDEGDYYETGDKELLEQKWNFLLKKFDEFAGLLENNLAVEDKKLSAESLLNKIENIIKLNYGSDADIQSISDWKWKYFLIIPTTKDKILYICPYK